MNTPKPSYPVYVISKGRADCCFTADFLIEDGIDFHIVIEPQEQEKYATRYGEERLKILPFSNLGLGSIPARNWCWEDSIKSEFQRHWIIDDNIRGVRRWYKGRRIECRSGYAFKSAEDFTDRYENIAVTGFNYTFFACEKRPPFSLNNHVYSTLLIKNDIDYRWRGRYNEDTDLCLQVISGGWCTVLIHAFLIDKAATLTMKGGNATELYKGDGRLKMARSLERMWPGVVYTDRRFKRPQHFVKNEWKNFDNKLIRRKDINWKEIEKQKVNEYGMKLAKKKETIQSETLRQFVDEMS